MPLDYATLESLKRNHPAWKLLNADYAPMAVSFFYRAFIASNSRGLSRSELSSRLEDELYRLRESAGDEAFPKRADEYLEDWAQDSRGWLRKYYPQGSDEPHFDLTSATVKAVAWLDSLAERSFVGTESRLLTVFDLLKGLAEGSRADVDERLRTLKKRQAEIADQIERVQRGELEVLDETAIRDRFQQLASVARDLLTDFREVEHNFRSLDRQTREQIARWEGSKGELLETILGERDTIADSDQGRSFRAFWDFLMSTAKQEELSALLDEVFLLPAVRALRPDERLRRVHYDWLEAGEHTQRTVALLSQQLRRFLDDKVWLENRRIMQILRGIETNALSVRASLPEGPFLEIDESAPTIDLPMERPLYNPPLKGEFASVLAEADDEIPTDALFNQVFVDKAVLADRVRRLVQERGQVTLAEVVEAYPLDHGLAELVVYLALAGEDRKTVFNDDILQKVSWIDATGERREAELPQVIYGWSA